MDGTQTGTTTPVSGTGSSGTEEVLQIPKSTITGVFPLDAC